MDNYTKMKQDNQIYLKRETIIIILLIKSKTNQKKYNTGRHTSLCLRRIGKGENNILKHCLKI